MMKLFRSGFRRYTKNIVFWICLCVSVIVGLLIGINIKDSGYIDDTYIIAEFFIFPILVSLLLGREYSDGAFRNKIVTGHSKGKVFLSECVLSVIACLALYLSICFISIVMNVGVFLSLPIGIAIKFFLGFTLLHISIVVILTVICMFIPRPAIMVVVSLLLVFGILAGANSLYNSLSAPETFTKYEIDENGKRRPTDEVIENPHYVGGAKREIYTAFYYSLPAGQMTEYVNLLSPYLKDNDNLPALNDEDNYILNICPIYSIGVIAIILSIGYISFRKKDIK